MNKKVKNIYTIKSKILVIILAVTIFSGCSFSVGDAGVYKIPKSFLLYRNEEEICKQICEWDFNRGILHQEYQEKGARENIVNDIVFSVNSRGMIEKINDLEIEYDDNNHINQVTSGGQHNVVTWNSDFTKATSGQRTYTFDSQGNPKNCIGKNGNWDEEWETINDEYGNFIKIRSSVYTPEQYLAEFGIPHDENNKIAQSYGMSLFYDDDYVTECKVSTNETIKIEYSDVTRQQYIAYRTLKNFECPYMSYYFSNYELDYVLPYLKPVV